MTPPKTNGPAQADSPLPVVDSFLLRDGRVVRPDLHRARFARGALAAGADQLELDDFFRHVGRVFAGQASNGDWFPKLSWDGREFSCQIRPAPALRSTTTLAVILQSDPRRFPQIKGPDMETLGRQRAAAREVGADDAVVVEGSEIFEAANGALVFFDEEGPFAAPREQILPSVTWLATVGEGGIVKHWRERHKKVTVEEALQLPAWCGSALHGWTRVTGWVLAGGRRVEALAAPDPGELNCTLWEHAAAWS